MVEISKSLGVDSLARLASKILVLDSGCWLWTGYRNHQGYGAVRWEGRTWLSHRLLFTLLVRDLEEGETLDHLCRFTSCCNPAHLDPVSLKVNILRGTGPTAVNSRKVICIHGHPLTEDNVYVGPRGGRECKTCRRRIDNARYQRDKLAKAWE